MELQNSFVVPAGLDEAWAKLLDLEAVAPCLPGATLSSHEGEDFAGAVKVKLGPVSMVYNGTARFAERDDVNHQVVIEAAGKDTKGTSTAQATVRTQLTAEAEARTRVDVVTDLAITGRPAQFGRGVMQDVAGRIIDQFAENLAHLIGEEGVVRVTEEAGIGAPAAEPAAVAAPVPATSLPHAEDAIDLVDAAAAPVLKRLVPVVVGLVVLWVVWRLLRRRG